MVSRLIFFLKVVDTGGNKMQKFRDWERAERWQQRSRTPHGLRAKGFRDPFLPR